MTQERDEAIAKVYEELGPVKTEILQRYTGLHSVLTLISPFLDQYVS